MNSSEERWTQLTPVNRLVDLVFRLTGLLEEEPETTMAVLSSTRLEEMMTMMISTLKQY
jgi:hypothetical protein